MATELESIVAPPTMRVGEPAWAIATLFPLQGNWSEGDYFRLEAEKFVELVNGCIEVLPMPTWLHGEIALWFAEQLKSWNQTAKLGGVIVAPVPLKLTSGIIREPDVFLVERAPGAPRPDYPTSAVVVMEVVSAGNEARKRDFVDKRNDYANAGIPEYWIIDPLEKSVTVLKLKDATYEVHGRFDANQIATSARLDGFTIDCAKIWALEKE